MSIDISTIITTIEGKIVELAKSTVSNYVEQATTDGNQLLTTIKDDLARWTQQLADGKLKTSDFETLVIGDKDLVEMTALKQAGLALVRADQFKAALFNLVIDTVFSIIKI